MSSIHAAARQYVIQRDQLAACDVEKKNSAETEIWLLSTMRTLQAYQNTHTLSFFFYSYQVGFSVSPFFVICSPNTSKIVSMPQMK